MEDDKATTGSSTYHINKLTETNYRSWSQQLRWILDERDLLEIVEGTEQKPTPPAEPASAPEGTATTATSESIAEARETYQESLAAWTKKSKKARTIIGSSISASIMIYIEGINDPAEMWKTLQEKYSPKTQTTLLQTFREFIETKMDEAVDTMEQHLQKLERLKRRYEEHGEIMPETIYKGTLLSSVPETYKW